MSHHHKDLKKLGQDFDQFEKKLEKVVNGKNVGRTLPNKKERKSITSNEGISGKPKSATSSKPTIRKNFTSRNQQLASVEVSIKTKCPDKSKKGMSKHSTVITVPCDATSSEKLQSVHHPSKEHCCCLSSAKTSKNLIWSNLLKHSPTGAPKFMVIESKELEMTKTERQVNHKMASSNKTNESEDLPLRHNNTKSLQSKARSISSEEADKEIFSRGASEDCMDGKNWLHKNNSGFGPEFNNGAKPNIEKTLSHPQLSDTRSSVPLRSIETLQYLIDELHSKINHDEDESTQKLVNEMQLVLERMYKGISASEGSYRSKLSTRKSSSRGAFDIDSPNNNVETQVKANKVSEGQGSYVNNEKVLLRPESDEIINNKILNGGASKLKGDNSEINRNDNLELPNRIFSPGNKFELPTKLKNDKVTQINLTADRDEKVKAEIDFIKKQLNLQLKSVDNVTEKESECKLLIVNLIDKVKKLEDQVNEQTKAAQHFFAQSNMLSEQNNLIPVLQASQDLLSQRLHETLHNYEKLKTEYCLLKLEKEKYLVLNNEKDKELKRFKEEIMNIQFLVEQQMNYLKNFEGYDSATDKVDTLMNIIDSQSNIIKSRLGPMQLGDGASSSPISSPTSYLTSSSTLSPVSTSRKLDLNKQSGATTGQSGNIAKDIPTNCYMLNIPELKSPNSS